MRSVSRNITDPSQKVSEPSTRPLEINSKEESNAIQTIAKLNGIETEIKVNSFAHLNKGLIYVYGYNMRNFEVFRERLIEQHGLQDVKEAPWIKTRSNNRATPLLLTFRNELHQYIDILGEIIKTRVNYHRGDKRYGS